MRTLVLSGTVLVACATACDPCPIRPLEEVGAAHYYDEIWAINGHNLVIDVWPERLPFDLLLEAMESIDAEFRCSSEDQQRAYEEECDMGVAYSRCRYQVRLPRDVCWEDAVAHFDSTYLDGFSPAHIAWVAEPPEARCGSAIYLAPE